MTVGGTVSDAPLHCILWVASVAHHYTSGHGTAVASADTSTTIFEVDAAERHQSSRRPPHESGCQDPGRRARRAPESVSILSTTSARSDRRGADTCASLQARGARCRQWPAAAAPQERPIRKWLGVRPSASAGSMSTSVNGLELTMCSASSRCGELLREGSLNVAANAVLIDRTKRSQAPPMFGAPGGMNFRYGADVGFLHLLVPLVCSSVLCLRRRNSCRCPNTSLSEFLFER
ncbi:hypothetical protein EVAR_55275_1 [Eumeta japonica]|uniref:Uncharacterized protein n=1 Tax=Eumeta variegata TaxID=151549 RepID=A0A4C1ZEY7_EUMVA|nr:hypothetical protein EVAR_55275_1 [Eumeta japonica]